MDVRDRDLKVALHRRGNSSLRLLDFDDLFLLRFLLEGHTIAATAKHLGLTQPAVTQRVRKIERVIGNPILERVGRHVRLTQVGKAFCTRAKDALFLMRDVVASPRPTELRVCADFNLAALIAWRGLKRWRSRNIGASVHLSLGTSEANTRAFDEGEVSALVSSVSLNRSTIRSVKIIEDDFFLVATPKIAKSIQAVEDLKSETLIELDASFDLLRRMDPAVRAGMRFRDAWHVSQISQAREAVLLGLGLSILPRQLVNPDIIANQLSVVLPTIDIAPETVWLHYHGHEATDPYIEMLVGDLKRSAL